MKRQIFLSILVLVPLIALSAIADTLPILDYVETVGSDAVRVGAGINTSKAAGDTVVLMDRWGSGAPYNGQFQTELGESAWNGWTTADLTLTAQAMWQVSDYYADNLGYDAPHGEGNMALWCGFEYASCGGTDVDGGYGSGWYHELHYRTPAADTADSTNVTVNFQLNIDSEDGYDGVTWFKVEYNEVDGAPDLGYRNDVEIATGTGLVWNDTISFTAHFEPGEYLNDNVDVMIVGISDAGWDDFDCENPTHGLCQLDDLEVIIQSGNGAPQQVSFLDFEDGDSFAPWVAEYDENFVGDYAWVGVNGDMDECSSNGTPQALFVNYGQYADFGVEAAVGDTYRYGPNGYVVEYLGGMADDSYHLHNAIRSPIMPWPNQDYDGIFMAFDVYTHEEKTNVSTGMYYEYQLRSTDGLNPEDIEVHGFTGYPYVVYGGPAFLRGGYNGTEDMEQGRRWVQLQLTAYEIGWIWNIDGTDGVPAPCFDNVRLIVYPVTGVAMSGRNIDFAQDAFPAIGVVDYTNLGQNSVRFDMAQNISPAEDERLDFGDSVVINCVPVRTGSILAGPPEMFYTMHANPLFDAYRTSGLPNQGSVVGTPAPGEKYSFDLPDTGFLFPGDVLQYYFRGVDDLDGDQTVTIMPRDTSGFGDFTEAFIYDQDFEMRALPTMYSATEGDQPKVLFWNDFSDRGGEEEWHFALQNLGVNTAWDLDGSHEGGRYDQYYTKNASSGVGNGLGGTANRFLLAGYETMLYTCGNLSAYTITPQDWDSDAGNDIGVLDSWLRLGGKSMFLTGDDLAFSLSIGSGSEVDFMTNWMGLNFSDQDIRQSIGGQATPLVKSVRTADPTKDVFVAVPQWIAYGGCFGFNKFDAVTPAGNAISLAEWTSSDGQTDQYTYSAATLNEVDEYSAKVISMPYDLMYVYTDPAEGNKAAGTLAARTRVLDAVLQYFGVAYDAVNSTETPVVAQAFTASNYPNPFNPETNVEFNMPKAGHLTLKVFNVRGELVKTLVDEVRLAGPGTEKWDGTNSQGAPVASGVYFYEARTNGEVRVNKMALVK